MTQMAPQESAPKQHLGHGGGDGHLCWRCAFKQALEAGVTVFVWTLAEAIAPEILHERESTFQLVLTAKDRVDMRKLADRIQSTVNFLDRSAGGEQSV